MGCARAAVAVCALLALPGARVASAGAFATLSSDTYGPNEVVLITLGDLGFFPSVVLGPCVVCPPPGRCDNPLSGERSTRAYIVPAGSVGGSSTVALDPLAVIEPTVINQTDLFGILNVPIAFTAPQGTLGDGSYDLIFDECENGVFDPDQDSIVASFSVEGASDAGPGTELNPAIDEYKKVAGAQAVSSGALVQRFNNVRALATFYSAAGSAAGSAGRAAALKSILDTGGSALDLLRYTDAGAASVIRGEAWDISGNLLAATATRLQARFDMYASIADDPPDPAFHETVVLNIDPALRPSTPGDLGSAFTDAHNNAMLEAGSLRALLGALEKFQGAVIANDAPGALRQALGVADYAALSASLAMASADRLGRLGESMRAESLSAGGGLDAFAEIRGRLVGDGVGGLTPAEDAFLTGLGLDVQEKQTLVDAVVEADLPEDPLDDLLDALDEASAQSVSNVVALLELAASALDEVAALRPSVPDVAPRADAGGPYEASAGHGLTLDATGSHDPDSPAPSLVFEWDTDLDGAFDDATGPGPTVTLITPGETLVGLRVSDPDGNQDVTYAHVTIEPTDTPPGAVTDPAHRVAVVPAGECFTGVIATFDDAGPVSTAWSVNDAPAQAGGDEFVWTSAPADAGVNLVTAAHSDQSPLTLTTRTDWFLMVSLIPVASPGSESVNLGTIPPGTPTGFDVVFANSGAAPLSVWLTQSGPGLAAQDTFPVSVAPGEEALLSFTFTPSVVGDVDTTLAFETNDILNERVTISVEASVRALCPADLAPPYGVVDFDDVLAFLVAFQALDPLADLSPPFGQFDFDDILAFLSSFNGGCP